MMQETTDHARLVDTVNPSCWDIVRYANTQDHLLSRYCSYIGAILLVIMGVAFVDMVGIGIGVWIFGWTLEEMGIFGIIVLGFFVGFLVISVLLVTGALVIEAGYGCVNYYRTKRQEFIQKNSGTEMKEEKKEEPGANV